mmetsp:Transcript_9912/g.33108  ORF Transcript_9912/g.33108 Transcript_9912/m.33108 type:complete len:214 (+) Transcript_9912:911-1552(+)
MNHLVLPPGLERLVLLHVGSQSLEELFVIHFSFAIDVNQRFLQAEPRKVQLQAGGHAVAPDSSRDEASPGGVNLGPVPPEVVLVSDDALLNLAHILELHALPQLIHVLGRPLDYSWGLLARILLHEHTEGRGHVLFDRIGHVRMENHNSPEVSCVSAVVASGEDGEKPAVMPILESPQGGRDLMGSDTEREAVGSQETFGDVWTKPDAVLKGV